MRKINKAMSVGAISLAMLMASPVWAEEADSGNQAYGDASSSVIAGSNINATSTGAEISGGGSQNVAVGSSLQIINGQSNIKVDGFGALVIGGNGNTSIGSGSQVIDGTSLQAIGYGATSGRGNYNTAIGSQSYAGGSDQQSSSLNTAIGAGAQAYGGNSVAIGANSVANQEQTVSVGRPGYERRIMNVAPGIYDTDAVNMSQLRSLDSRVNRVGAMAFAFSGLAPMAYDPKEPTQYSAAMGTYNSTGAIALGVYHYTSPDVMLNAAVALSGDGWEKSARFGVTWKTGGPRHKEIAPAVPAEQQPTKQRENIIERTKRILAESEQAE